MSDKDHHVIIHFGSAIPAGVQGEVLMAVEKDLRRRGIMAEVFKDPMGDDLKLRRQMTHEQREKL